MLEEVTPATRPTLALEFWEVAEKVVMIARKKTIDFFISVILVIVQFGWDNTPPKPALKYYFSVNRVKGVKIYFWIMETPCFTHKSPVGPGKGTG